MTVTNDLLIRIGKAALREAEAAQAAAESEAHGGQRDQARLDRTAASIAKRALADLIAEAKS